MELVDVVAAGVLLFVGSRLAIASRRSLSDAYRDRALQLVRGLRIRHFLPVPLVLAAVITAALVLVQLPVLSFGWWTAMGGVGNPVFGVTEETAGTVLALLVPVVFLALLVPALPLLVEREERAFRLGAEAWSWPKRLAKAVLFGLAHAIIGIPIGVALALSLGGLWFTLAYLAGWRRGGRAAALAESTRSHLAYNTTIVAVVGLALVADIVLVLI